MDGEKLTIVHTERNNRLVVSVKSLDKFMERITKDDAKRTITQFRDYVPYLPLGYDGYKDMPKWMHVMPAAEFQKAENGTLVMKRNNGILLFTLADIKGDDGLEGAKQKVAALPSTLAAFLSADGKMLHVLITSSAAEASGMARTISEPWLAPCPPATSIGKTGSTSGFWAWWISGEAFLTDFMATRWRRSSSPSRATTRVLSVAAWYHKNFNLSIPTISYCQKSVKFSKR